MVAAIGMLRLLFWCIPPVPHPPFPGSLPMTSATALYFDDRDPRPLLVGIGGTSRPDSTTEHALRFALAHARKQGVRTRLFGGAELVALPVFNPDTQVHSEPEQALLDAVRAADGLIIATPSYHGGVSALIKNAIDLLEALRKDPRPYLDGRAVGCIVSAGGWQGGTTTLGALRSIIHALRGWPTPLGVTLNTAGGQPLFDVNGQCLDGDVQQALETMGEQALAFAGPRALKRCA